MKDDAELLQEYRGGRSQDVFAEIFRRHWAMVFRVCFRTLGNTHEAEEAAQATFLVLAQHPEVINKTLTGWLHGVALRISLNSSLSRRRRQRREKVAAGRSDPVTEGAEIGSDREDLRRVLDASLARLPEKFREALVLRYLENRSVEEAAGCAGCPQGTMIWRTQEALSRLRDVLGRNGAALAPAILLAFLAEEAAATTPVASGVLTTAGTAQLAEECLTGLKWAKTKLYMAAVSLAAVAVAVPVVVKPERPVVPEIKVGTVSTKDALTDANWEAVGRAVRPQPGEWQWLGISWITDFWEARRRAAAEDKPILYYYSAGSGYNDPLGVCSHDAYKLRFAAEWDNEIIALANDRFVPYMPYWGSSGYAKEREWFLGCFDQQNVFSEGEPPGWYKAGIEGTRWIVLTTGGKLLRENLRGGGSTADALRRVLIAYSQLPESVRKTPPGDRGAFDPSIEHCYTEDPPPDGIILTTYDRTLTRDFRPSPNFAPEALRETLGDQILSAGPQRDAVWITASEWKSLIPANPKEGHRFPMPEALRKRLILFYLVNRNAHTYWIWKPKEIRAEEMTLTVERVTPAALCLRIDGHALMDNITPTGNAFDPRRPDGARYDCRLRGAIEYDRARGKITRFDLTALGDWKGITARYYFDELLPFGISFQLDMTDYALPPERRRKIPGGLFIAKWFEPVDYWNPR